MPAAGSCKVCSSPQRDAIEVLLLGGAKLRGVARDTGLPESTLRLHLKRCRRKAAGKAPQVNPAELVLPAVDVPADHPLAPILAELRSIHGESLEAWRRAVEAKDDRTVALLVQQLRNNLKAQADLTAKVHRDDRTPEERLDENPEWRAFLGRLLRATDRCCPSCRDSLRDGLEAPQ